MEAVRIPGLKGPLEAAALRNGSIEELRQRQLWDWCTHFPTSHGSLESDTHICKDDDEPQTNFSILAATPHNQSLAEAETHLTVPRYLYPRCLDRSELNFPVFNLQHVHRNLDLQRLFSW
jgi:hypothetical protein